MNQYFFDQLDTGVILLQEGAIIRFNQQAQNILPVLSTPDEKTVAWLLEFHSGARGEIHNGALLYSYQVMVQGEETMILLEENKKTTLTQPQLEGFLYHLREDLTSISAKVEGADLAPPIHAALSHGVTRILRNLNNCDLAMGEKISDTIEVFDISAMLQILATEIVGLLPETQITHHLPGKVLVESNMAYLRKAVLGLIANSLAQGDTLTMKITQMKREALLEIRDENTLGKPLADVLAGRSQGQMPSSNGIGLGILAVQQTLRSFKCNLWAEESKEGGLILMISVPLHKAKLDELQTPIHQIHVDRTGGWNDLLLELAPILPSRFYAKDWKKPEEN